MNRLLRLGAALVFFALTAASPGWAQIKLYFKDGNYQLVKSYQVIGNRVRYYSLESSEWEEVPVFLVDFKATEQAEKAKKEEQQKILQQAAETENSTYQLPQNKGYLIAPGVRLPSAEGVYAYDGTRVITLLQSASSLARDKRRMALSLAVPAPLLKSRSIAQIPGRAAAVRILNTQPVFYAQFADNAGSHLQLLRLKAGKNSRSVENLDSGLRGKVKESRSTLPVIRKQLAAGLVELKPAQPLPSGEYAIGELEANGKLNLDVWDFGIGPVVPKVH